VFVAATWRANLAATRAKGEAEGLLRDSYLEQGRLRVLEGDKLGALAPLATAYRMGSTGAATRLLLEEAARPARARLRTLAGHADKLWDIAYSPDGKWLATASADNTARIWDAETGALRATLPYAHRVSTVAFSPDSRLLASGDQERTVRVWDVIAGREVAALPAGGPTWRVAFSPDGSVLLTAAPRRVVKLWRIPGGAPAGELGGHGKILGARFCEDGTCIVTWDDARVVVWDAATLAPRTTYQPPGEIRAAAVSRTGALIAISTLKELVLLRGDGSLIAKHVAYDLIDDIDISPDESVIAAGSRDRTVRLWSAAGEPRGVLVGHRAKVMRVRFTAAGDRLITTSADNTARLWSASGMLLGELAGHTNLIMAAAVRADGDRLATASWDHTAMVWDLSRAQELRPIGSARHGAPPLDLAHVGPPTVAFGPGGHQLAVARADGELWIVDVQTGAVPCTASGKTPIQHLAWTGGDEIAVVRSGGRAVELWSARRCAVASTLDHPAPITAMSTRSGPRLVTAAGGVVRVHRGGRLESSLTGYTGGVAGVGVDGDDVYAVTSAPATVVVDAIGDPARRRVFGTATKPIIEVRFDREQGRITAASLDQFLYVWDAATGALAHKLEGSGPLFAVRTSPDGAITIGVGGASPTVWDRRSGARLAQLEGHSDLAADGVFIDDRLFVSIALNQAVIVWDVAAAQALMTFHDVRELAISDDRRSVAFVGAAGVRLWSPRAPSPDLEALRPHAP
jgi:WD40 repeat protein